MDRHVWMRRSRRRIAVVATVLGVVAGRHVAERQDRSRQPGRGGVASLGGHGLVLQSWLIWLSCLLRNRRSVAVLARSRACR